MTISDSKNYSPYTDAKLANFNSLKKPKKKDFKKMHQYMLNRLLLEQQDARLRRNRKRHEESKARIKSLSYGCSMGILLVISVIFTFYKIGVFP